MNPPIIQSLWIGERLSRLEQLCAASFIANGHAFHLYVYNDVADVPAGVVIKDGNEILPKSEIYLQNNRASYGPFADWFRYALLYQRGGYWVDMDMVCIKPFDFDGIVFGETGYGAMGNGVLGFPEKHEVMAALSHACRDHNADMPWDDAKTLRKKRLRRKLNVGRESLSYIELGPLVFCNAVKHFGLQKHVRPFTTFYPIEFSSWSHCFDRSFPNGVDFYADTYAVHLWNEASRRIPGFDKDARFDKHSLFEQLKAKYGIPTDSGAGEFTHEEINALARAKVNRQHGRQQHRIRRATLVAYIFAGIILAQCFFLLSS